MRRNDPLSFRLCSGGSAWWRHAVYVKMSGISMKYIRERGCNLLFITTKFISRLALTVTDYTTTQASPLNFVNGFF